jgi:hypothetical protein
VIAEEWKVLQEEAGDEAIEYKVEDVRRSNFTTMPEDLHLWVLDNDFPETTLWREGDSLVCEITEHIYSKFWWHTFSAGAFSEAMEHAVVRLSREGHPFRSRVLILTTTSIFGSDGSSCYQSICCQKGL